MKLLLDANVSWRLAATLSLHFETCIHVDNSDLTIPAKDIDIWNFALQHNFVIVTNDEDFLTLLNIKGFPPKIILLKTGNQTNNFIEALLIKHKSAINLFGEAEDYGVLELF